MILLCQYNHLQNRKIAECGIRNNTFLLGCMKNVIMDYRLEDLIDITLLQRLQDKLNVIYSFPSAIIDNDGKVLTAVAWQDICTKFHRINPECEKECIKSDKYIMEHLHEANPAVSYQCPHGLIDNATPIIIDGKHLGNFFIGQFFLEMPDLQFFRQQAERYGFDEKAYLEAVESVPVWTKDNLYQYLDFIKSFIEIIAGMALKNLKEIETRKVLNEYESRLKSYAELSPMAGIEFDKNFIITKWTRSAEKIFGWTAEETIGKAMHELKIIYESDLPEVNSMIEKLTTCLEESVTTVNRNYRKDGKIIICEWYNTILKDETGQLTYVLSQAHDITERKKTEEKLLFIMKAVESSSDAIGISDARGHHFYQNKALTDLFGYSTAEELDSFGGGAVCVKDSDVSKEMFSSITSGNSWTGELEMITKSGNVFPAYERADAIKDEDGSIIGLIGVITDITEKKNTEKNLIRAKEHAEESERRIQQLYYDLQAEEDELMATTEELTATTDSLIQTNIELLQQKDRAEESEKQFSAAFYSNPIPLSIVSYPEGIIQEVNNAGCDFYGFTREQFINSTTLKLQVWENFNDRDNIFKELSSTGKLKLYEAHVRLASQEIRTVLCSAEQILWKGQKCLLHSNIDITERKLVEKLLQESKEKAEETAKRLELALISGHFGIWDWNIKDNTMIWDERMLELYGITKDTFKGNIDAWIDSLHPEDKLRSIDECNAAINGEKDFDTTFRVVRPDGSIIYIKADGFVIRDSVSTPIRMLGINKDVSSEELTKRELIKAKEIAEENELKYSSIVKIVPDGILIHEKGNIIFANEAAANILNAKSCNDFIGVPVINFVHPDSRDIIIKRISSSVENNTIASTIEETLVDFEGNPVYCLVTGIPFIYRGKKTMLVEFTDIGQLKKTETELIKAKEKAEESDRLKSAFLSNMSHEIRTPMNGILGFTDLLKNPNLSGEKQQKFIEIIEKSGERMLNTINNIVDISKIESGLMQINFRESNINEQVQFAYDFFTHESEKKGLQLFYKNGLPQNEAYIKTDHEKVYAVLVNLIKNAIKFTNKGIIEFGYDKVVSKDSTGQQNDFLQFFVKDTGIGIPAQNQGLIFERFMQNEAGYTRVFEGTGLGLSISKSYVEMLNGHIWVESQEGKGSSFYFTIPYNAISTRYTNLNNKENTSTFGKLKILIAEDDEASRQVLELRIADLSKEILIAENGIQAVDLCRKNTDLDLILMDIRMPKMDGYEATRQIRQFNNDVIIIAQTANGFSADREESIEAGCNEYISKPINYTKLNQMINTIFKKP